MQPMYIVICGTHEPYVAERKLEDMGREQTIKSIAAGEWRNISSVIEIGTDRDVTSEFLAAADYPADDYRTTLTGEDKAAWDEDRRRDLEIA
jgi:hypothetical protein